MVQTTNAATQLQIKELLRKTQEKEEERKKKKQEMQASDAERQREKEEGQVFDQIKTAPGTSSSQSTAEIGTGLEKAMTDHQIKGPEKITQTVRIQRPPSESQEKEDMNPKVITARSKAGWTVILERIDTCDKLETKEKSDDKSREEWPKIDVSDGSEDQKDGNDEISTEEPIIDFEDPLYELSQSY